MIFRAGCDSRSAVKSASASAQDLVQFQNRQYSLDERRENVNKNGGAGKLPDTLPRMMDMADIYRYGKRERKVIENGCKKIFTIINIMKDIIK